MATKAAIELISHLDNIVKWFNHFSTEPIPYSEHKRLKSLIEKIETKINNTKITTREKSSFAPIYSKEDIVICKTCNAKLKNKNTEKHEKKCPGLKKTKSNTIHKDIGAKLSGNKTCNRMATKTYGQQYTRFKPVHNTPTKNSGHDEERRLDGSRDYWQIRDQGAYGSYPSYDDHSEESRP